MVKIVILDGHTLNPGDLSWDGLRRFGEIDLYDRTEAHLVLERSENADILVINKVKLTAAMVDSLPRLRHVAMSATGYNNIDIKVLRERGICASNIRNYGTDTVAQHTFALLLELTNHVGLHSESVRKGKWSKLMDFCFWEKPMVEISGKIFGIIGWGNIGKKVAEIAAAFGMKVIFFSHRKIDNSFTQVDMDTLFSTADVVSLHTHLTDNNYQLVNKYLLEKMKPSAFFLNTSRGALVNEADLYEALKTGIIAGAALDVLSVEPPAEGNILIDAPNCIITPHNAWASREARQRMMEMLEENIEAFLSGSPKNIIT